MARCLSNESHLCGGCGGWGAVDLALWTVNASLPCSVAVMTIKYVVASQLSTVIEFGLLPGRHLLG
jgi:hypothetical protein